MRVLKIVIVGPGAVGKTSCMKAYITRKHKPTYSMTVGADFHIKTIEVDGEEWRLQLWDLAGQEKFGSVRKIYYLGADAVIIMVDLCISHTMDTAVRYIKEEVAPLTENRPLACVTIVGNKVDLGDRIVVTDSQLEELTQLARDELKTNTFYTKTSALQVDTLDSLFDDFIRCILKSRG